MRLLIGFFSLICLIQTKLPTVRFEISFKGIAQENNLLNKKASITSDNGIKSEFTKVDVDVKADNGQKHLRALITCDIQSEHVDITMMKNDQKETVNIKLVPGKGTSFYMEDLPLNSIETNVNGCEVILNSKTPSFVSKLTKIVLLAVLFIQLNF